MISFIAPELIEASKEKMSRVLPPARPVVDEQVKTLPWLQWVLVGSVLAAWLLGQACLIDRGARHPDVTLDGTTQRERQAKP